MLGMIEDPVCGMQINIDTAPARTELDGEIYYFCSEGCKEAFERNPPVIFSRKVKTEKPALDNNVSNLKRLAIQMITRRFIISGLNSLPFILTRVETFIYLRKS